MAILKHRYGRAAALPILAAALGAGGCVHVQSGYRLALAAMDPARQGAVPGQAWWYALAGVSLAVVLGGVLFLRPGRQRTRAPHEPLDREELALYRTSRDSLNFLLKKRLERTKVVPLGVWRRRRERDDD